MVWRKSDWTALRNIKREPLYKKNPISRAMEKGFLAGFSIGGRRGGVEVSLMLLANDTRILFNPGMNHLEHLS